MYIPLNKKYAGLLQTTIRIKLYFQQLHFITCEKERILLIIHYLLDHRNNLNPVKSQLETI